MSKGEGARSLGVMSGGEGMGDAGWVPSSDVRGGGGALSCNLWCISCYLSPHHYLPAASIAGSKDIIRFNIRLILSVAKTYCNQNLQV